MFEALKLLFQHLRVNGLRQITVKARIQYLLPVTLHGIRSYREYRQSSQARILSNFAHDSKTIQFRHADIEQQYVWSRLLNHRKRLLTVTRFDDGIASRL